MSRWAVIMAGGAGTRFWPASRAARPKQFLSLASDRSMLTATRERLTPLIAPERIVVVTGQSHVDHAKAALPNLPAANLLVEPAGRNTAACIGWAAQVIAARDADASVAVLPADHSVLDAGGFVAHLEAAFEAARDRIVLFGIVPTRPETGYGYILRGPSTGVYGGKTIYSVERFVEKPDRTTAERYVSEGTYLWNSGMFVFPAAVIVEEISRHLPDLATGLLALARDPGSIDRVYPALPSISIDYGVMERTSRIAVLPASFGWSDVGSWDASMDLFEPDEKGNVVHGDAVLIGVERSMVDARGHRVVAVVDVEDLIVVDTDDALLIVRRGHSQEVKKVVEALRAADRKELL